MKNIKNESISRNTSILVVLISLLGIAITLILNITMREGLFIQGINFIYSYQQNSSNGFVRAVYNIISLLGNTIVAVLYLVLLFLISYRKLSVMVFLTYAISNIYLMIILKSGFQ